ncbi:MAG: ABC transporter ATP-binding protein [Myxococcota bacterium]
MLATEHLAFGYGNRRVGEDVSLGVAPGEIACLLGPNGSGKTTLFKTLLGLLPPLGGTIHIDGADATNWTPQARARSVAYVPQAAATSFAYTVREIVLMGRAPHLPVFAVPSKTDHEKAESALARVGIAALGARVATELSGGERQLVLIARALVQECRTMIMDEPTASLDLGNRVRVLSQLRRLASEGVSAIIATHEPDHALAIADHAFLLSQGRLVGSGKPADVITTESLSRLYGVTVDVIESAGSRVTVPRLGPIGTS